MAASIEVWKVPDRQRQVPSVRDVEASRKGSTRRALVGRSFPLGFDDGTREMILMIIYLLQFEVYL